MAITPYSTKDLIKASNDRVIEKIQNAGSYSSEREKEKARKDLYYSKQADLLKKNYGTSVSELDASTKRAKEEAAISHELLKKYLPTTMRAIGIEGTGSADSLSLQALSNYQNNLADITTSYNASKATLDKDLNSRLSELERYKNDDYDTIDAKYDAKAEAESTVAYGEVSSYIENSIAEYLSDGRTDGKISQAEYDQLESYLKESPNLTDTDRATLENYLKGYERYVRSADEQSALNEAQAKKSAAEKTKDKAKVVGGTAYASNGKGDNFKLSYEGSKYLVQKGYDVIDESMTNTLNEAYGSAPTVGASIVYNGRIYMFLRNGSNEERWCEIEARDREKDGNDKPDSYAALMKAINSSNT